MASWEQFSVEAPALAEAIKARFTATKHHVMATLRADGSPRVSGTEVEFYGPDLTFGSMWQARKALDLQRDARVAIHANPGDGSMDGGDAKVAGSAVEVVDQGDLGTYVDDRHPPEPFHLFRVDLREAVLTSVDQERKVMIVELWRPGRPVQRTERT
ncbi:pyridoxamine 5'-phosphate oxidase family protein [Cryptosporangium phraense]|uniref:Pyridoxamine 5'-phosphate oxidase family protein n=1 Tax=Cryptosporangium phraense TaxID=2593070 RepID=A0A545APD7_9ACTN|nr:pyridoxamine 5'-phosphate oxidase family protein [Cryptosporangium phraense]TQS43166.1 pyridoxamine 5'-phosphate oxidase family protein [Cryptosporangium phraense]